MPDEQLDRRHGLFTLFYTGYQKQPGTNEMGFWAVGFVTVKLQPRN
jgi:hypothetical protein